MAKGGTNMTNGQFRKTARLIDRDAEMNEIRRLADAAVHSGTCRVLYFRANGGLGKTRLLKESKSIIAKDLPQMLVSDIVDMYDFENRKPLEIERKLVDSLKREARQQGMTDEEFEDFFEDYTYKYVFFENIRGFSHKATREAEKNIHNAFIVGCNRLSKVYPIVFRFDTLESILNIKSPEYSFVIEKERVSERENEDNEQEYTKGVGANIVLNWFARVLKDLESALVIFAGRPVIADDPIILMEQQIDPLFDSLNLWRIDESDKLLEYLRECGIDIARDRIPYIRKITGGMPLLLSLYARTQPEKDAKFKTPHNYAEFEDSLIEQTFNLLETLPSNSNSDQLPEEQKKRQFFIFCLFILSCARRGIRREELRLVFDRLGMERDDDVIDSLDDETLIRSVPHWYQLDAAETTPEQQKENAKKNTLLLLHDEILALIDQSKKLDELEYRKPILNILCDISKEQVHNPPPGVPEIKLLSDHMYYELTRDIATGYRTYTIYADRFLRQRFIQDALILADVFWNTLYHEVPRGQDKFTPFLDRLAESQQVNSDDIRWEEQVRYVKRLRFIDDYTEAEAWAVKLYDDLVEKGVVPAAQDWTQITSMAHGNYYVFIDLCLTWATAMTRLRRDPDQCSSLLTKLIRLLESNELQLPLAKDEDLSLSWQLACLRRTFFLGDAYNTRGQLYDDQQYYQSAVDDLEKARTAFIDYQDKKFLLYEGEIVAQAAYFLNDDATADQAQVGNNLAYSKMRDGHLPDALELSQEIIDKYIRDTQSATTYQQALFYNTNALIHMRLGQYDEAKAALDAAKLAAEQSGVDRAIGLVSWALGIYRRAKWNNERLPDTNAELLAIDSEDFGTAAAKLQNEPGNLSDVFYDRARFARDLVLFFRSKSDPERAQDWWRQANKHLDRATEELGKIAALDMRHADLLETRASLYLLRNDDQYGDHSEAGRLLHEADELLRNNKDMPRYAAVVAGKIALQRGLLFLHQDQHQKALEQMAIALARAYVFAPKHRDQAAFEKLISGWHQEKQITTDALNVFVRSIYTGQVAVKAGDLRYLPPPADLWVNAWERSLTFFESLQRPIEEKANERSA
jgi:hypothetical protein